MKSYQKSITQSVEVSQLNPGFDPDIILLFISPNFKESQEYVYQIKERFPKATITGCSTSGEICGTEVTDASIVFNALVFNTTKHMLESIKINDSSSSEDAGLQLRQALDAPDLKHILVFSDGLNVNGADLVLGMNKVENLDVTITGGLAADGSDFENTFVINEGKITDKEILGLGFYGKDLKIGYGSKGGWDSFGVERLVTKSDKNILYELDGQPALKLYKSFLGFEAENLPASGLLFPLSIRTELGELPVVRTILSIDEEKQSLTFAGNIPEGAYARLMNANVDHLIDGAELSAKISKEKNSEDADFALLISCVGRRLVLNQLIEEEVEAVREVLGEKPKIGGFYSYGELAPFGDSIPCQLHNQTMTITTFSEM